MNTDDLLTQFRRGVPFPEEATANRIYAGALAAQHRSPRRRLILLVAVAAAVGLGAAGLTGAFTADTTQTSRTHTSSGGIAPWDSVSVTPTRNEDGALASISVTITPEVADATSEIEVLHSVGSVRAKVVFHEQVSTTPLPGPQGLSTWSGTLYPSDWSGGCESGVYRIQVISVPPGVSLTDAGTNRELDGGRSFDCR